MSLTDTQLVLLSSAGSREDLKMAEALGFAIPRALLSRADEIERDGRLLTVSGGASER